MFSFLSFQREHHNIWPEIFFPNYMPKRPKCTFLATKIHNEKHALQKRNQIEENGTLSMHNVTTQSYICSVMGRFWYTTWSNEFISNLQLETLREDMWLYKCYHSQPRLLAIGRPNHEKSDCVPLSGKDPKFEVERL